MLELSDITMNKSTRTIESNGNHVKQPKKNNRRDVSTSKKPKQDDKEMIDVEGNNKLGGAHEDEMQPQNILCKILLNPKPKLAKKKKKKKGTSQQQQH